MTCRAWLRWRAPGRWSRTRMVWPLEAGMGAAPPSMAKAASLGQRPGWDQAHRTMAATIGPTPQRVLRPAAEPARSRRGQTGGRNYCSQEGAGGMGVHFVFDDGIQQHPVGELEQLLARDHGLVWVDIPVCAQEATRVLLEGFGSHPPAAPPCVERNAVPKVRAYRDHIF